MKLFQSELFVNTMILIYVNKNFRPQVFYKIKTNNMVSVILDKLEYKYNILDFYYYKKPSFKNTNIFWKLYE